MSEEPGRTYAPDGWTTNDALGIYEWNGYVISQWTVEAWGPRDYYFAGGGL